MAPPNQLVQWLRRNYPRPQIDPEWLDGCYEWIEGEFHLNPATQLDEIIQHVESQLLQSNLSDSMVAGTGLPTNIPPIDKTMITGPAVLVEIISITDVGQSAFTLQNVRQARIDRADLAGLAGDGDDDEGPIPKYPRSMLRFQLSDGSTVLQAFEYRRLPELELGETPLGYKVRNSFVSLLHWEISMGNHPRFTRPPPRLSITTFVLSFVLWILSALFYRAYCPLVDAH
ncbi:hypothetical protein BKA93DRAFT_727364 [Sparassis latifolia]